MWTLYIIYTRHTHKCKVNLCRLCSGLPPPHPPQKKVVEKRPYKQTNKNRGKKYTNKTTTLQAYIHNNSNTYLHT